MRGEKKKRKEKSDRKCQNITLDVSPGAEVDGQVGRRVLDGVQVLVDLVQLVVVEQVEGQPVRRVPKFEARGRLLLDLPHLLLDGRLEVVDLDAVRQVLALQKR